jgi:HlyD family secretion protein
MNARTITALSIIVIMACNRDQNKFDATGTFEADEVIVSASANGKILSLDIDEGSTIAKDSVVGLVDPTDLSLQKQQVQASIEALHEKTYDATPQIKMLQDQLKVQQAQLDNLLHEQARIENLLKEDAAT